MKQRLAIIMPVSAATMRWVPWWLCPAPMLAQAMTQLHEHTGATQFLIQRVVTFRVLWSAR